MQPLVGWQLSTVQAVPSSQVFLLPVQVPETQTSSTVQTLPSSHGVAESGRCAHGVSALASQLSCGEVVNAAVQIAVGVNDQGQREVLGVEVNVSNRRPRTARRQRHGVADRGTSAAPYQPQKGGLRFNSTRWLQTPLDGT